MQKIYIVLTHTGTLLSNLIKLYTKNDYSHVSLAFDEDLNEMYSFGRIYTYNAFIGGFVREYLTSGTFKRFKNTMTSVYELEVTDIQYREIDGCKAIEIFKQDTFSIQELDDSLASLDIINKNFKTLTQYKKDSIIYYTKL